MAVRTASPPRVAKRLFNVQEYHRMADAGILLEDDPVELIEGQIIEKTSRGIVKRLFNVREYHRLADAGILSEDDRVELIAGEIVEMSPIGSRHAACVRALQELVQEKLRRTAQVSVQNPIQPDEHSEPQPDVALLKPRKDRYAHAHPKPADVLLIIEVAETTIDYDRTVKLPLYAGAEIPETWIVDLNQQVIEAFSAPRDGRYHASRKFKRGETVSSTSLPSLSLSVDEILG